MWPSQLQSKCNCKERKKNDLGVPTGFDSFYQFNETAEKEMLFSTQYKNYNKKSDISQKKHKLIVKRI